MIFVLLIDMVMLGAYSIENPQNTSPLAWGGAFQVQHDMTMKQIFAEEKSTNQKTEVVLLYTYVEAVKVWAKVVCFIIEDYYQQSKREEEPEVLCSQKGEKRQYCPLWYL